MKAALALALLALTATAKGQDCFPIPCTPTPGGPTVTKTRTPLPTTATRTKTPVPTITSAFSRTPTRTLVPTTTRTPGPPSNCFQCGEHGVVCDQYGFQYNYAGTWAPDVVGPYPPGPLFFNVPRPQDWKGPGVYSFATANRNSLTHQWGCPQVVSAFYNGPNPAFSPYIEDLYNIGVTGGCGPNVYCPMTDVNRGQMAVFLEKAMAYAVQHPEHFPPGWTPPPCRGLFLDVPCPVTPTPTVHP